MLESFAFASAPTSGPSGVAFFCVGIDSILEMLAIPSFCVTVVISASLAVMRIARVALPIAFPSLLLIVSRKTFLASLIPHLYFDLFHELVLVS